MKITKTDQFNIKREFTIRESKSGGFFLEEWDPDFHCNTCLGFYDTEKQACDRIEMLIGK